MRFIAIVILAACAAQAADLTTANAGRAGNVFLAGEQVVIPVPADGSWTLLDYEGNALTKTAEGRSVALGRLGVGHYELRDDKAGRVSLAVIEPLKAPIPPTSPISIDVASAWFYKSEAQQRGAADLCRLAGINWVRDRLLWGVLEPRRGKFAAENVYDATARIQAEAGLKVLQVMHASPPWAGKNASRFPDDLRDAYNFYREMAKRWKGKVLAYEPWNEADIDVFGGHTGSEIATFQKAAYLGLKAGDPDVIGCQNVFAIARAETLADFAANEASAYFDTYNLHHYVPFDQYRAIYAAHRAVSAGKPLWVSECNVPVQWTDEKTMEPTDEHLKWQANRVAKVYAMSLHEGSVNTFYFILGHYVERQTQFGIIREDLTPRPAYVALAAVGRLLADAKPMGRLKHDDPNAHVFAFRAKPDGDERVVLVAWRQGKGPTDLKLDAPIERVYDHLGRTRPATNSLTLDAAPVFVVMPLDAARELALELPPTPPTFSDARPAKVIVQAVIPTDRIDLARSAYALSPGEDHEITLRLYQFGDAPVASELTSQAPPGWSLRMPDGKRAVEPGGMVELTVALARRDPSPEPTTIRFHWSSARLSIRVVDEKSASAGH